MPGIRAIKRDLRKATISRNYAISRRAWHGAPMDARPGRPTFGRTDLGLRTRAARRHGARDHDQAMHFGYARVKRHDRAPAPRRTVRTSPGRSRSNFEPCPLNP